MSDDLVERVAREFCTVDGADPCEVVCGLCLHRAGMVVSVCMEEAAKVAEGMWWQGRSNLTTAPYAAAKEVGDEIAAAIRALKESK